MKEIRTRLLLKACQASQAKIHAPMVRWTPPGDLKKKSQKKSRCSPRSEGHRPQKEAWYERTVISKCNNEVWVFHIVIFSSKISSSILTLTTKLGTVFPAINNDGDPWTEHQLKYLGPLCTLRRNKKYRHHCQQHALCDRGFQQAWELEKHVCI